MRSNRRWFWLMAMALSLVVLVSSGWLFSALTHPFKGFDGERIFLVPPGSSTQQIAGLLEREGIISSSDLFYYYVFATGSAGNLKAGEYRFQSPSSIIEVADRLIQGDIYYHQVTIPEGLDMDEIAAIFVAAGFGTEAGFQAVFNDPGPVLNLDPEAPHLEGYLFPETYFLTATMSEESIANKMVANFRTVWNARLQARARELGMTVREVVTLASLIEEETGLAQERPLVSSVFHNRLERDIPLACDPTVVYAVKQVKDYDGVIHRSDLEIDSPYNTYRNIGLPPGPIASPGEASLEAALYPADTDYLFFVSRNDGSHVFSETLKQHNQAVQIFQRP